MSGKATWTSDHAASVVRAPAAAATLALCGLLYYLTASLELALRPSDNGTASLSPQQGMLVALLMTTRYRRWWLIVLPVLPAHLAAYWRLGAPPWLLTLEAIHTIALTVGIVTALRLFSERPNPFGRLREFMFFLLIILSGAALLNIVSPDVTLAAGTGLDRAMLTWRVQSVASALGILTWGSSIALGLLLGADWLRPRALAQYAEALLIATALFVTFYLTFAGVPEQHAPRVLLFIPLLWLSIRLGPGATALAVAVVCTLAAASGRMTHETVGDVQIFLIVLAITVLVVAVFGEERRRETQAASARATLARRQRDERLSLMLRASHNVPPEWHIAHDPDGTGFDRHEERFARLAMAGRITASIAHEINQPLSAIHHNAEAGLLLLSGEPLDRAELEEIFNDILGDNRRAGELAGRLGELLQDHELKLDPLDINAVVDDIVDLLRAESRRRHIHFDVRYAPLPVLLGDYVRLQTVLLNLILNGMDAMEGLPESRRRLDIRTSRLDTNRIQVQVIDRGRGIDPRNLPKIFDSYFIGQRHGPGIGLALARSIVEAHGGRIWARNNADGVGVTLAFEIDCVGTSMMPAPGPTHRYGARLN